VGLGLRLLVAEAPPGGQRGALQGGQLMPSAVAAQVRRHRGRQLRGMGVKAGARCLGNHGTQHMLLFLEPRHRQGMSAEVFSMPVLAVCR